MKKSISFSVALAFLVFTLFTGCGQKDAGSTAESTAAQSTATATVSQASATAEPAKLEGKIAFATHMTNVADTTLTAMAKEFMGLNPGTRIDVEGIKDYDSVMMTRIAAGEIPDLSIIVDSKISKDKYPEFYLPIDDIGFSKDNILFYENGLGPDNKLYAITDSINYMGVVYNKKVFADAGITAVPKTMDEMYAACEKLKAKGITPLGTAFKDGWTLFPFENQEFWNSAFTGDPNGKNPYIDQDHFIDDLQLNALKILRTFNQKGYFEKDIVSAGWDQMKADMGAGKIAMYYSQTWFPPQLVDAGVKHEEVGMFPWPETKYNPTAAGKMLTISKDTKSPELAKAFLTWMVKENKYAAACGYLSPLKGGEITDPAVKELLSYNLPLNEIKATNSNITEALNKAELDFYKSAGEYILAKDDAAAAKIVKDFNDKWAKVRKEFGGK